MEVSDGDQEKVSFDGPSTLQKKNSLGKKKRGEKLTERFTAGKKRGVPEKSIT